VRHGAVVVTGPHWQNFKDTYEAMIERGGAIAVHSAAELAEAVAPLLANEAKLASLRERAEGALAGLSGALPRTVEALLRYLPGEDELARAD
jgi:3-deoxy-D-manno-octulosonic-acid transferase